MKYLISLISCLVLFNANASNENDSKVKTSSQNAAANKALKNVNTLGLTKRRAAKKVSQSYPGKILSVKENTHYYKVRMLQPKGKVVDFKVNKSNGQVKKGKQ
ncbi:MULTISPECIES: PepSY domain-containing protein [Pseudoalteromonas]|uniref:PepSY domain-containing protein n=1 Tax=Pseudoalteromonas TaxID=53246 RepID=UPI00026CB7F0|nr:hypothetical protein [Pseudoalteromonas spongiae]ATC98431.1 hypothetical protein PSPO_a1334 [Pseudoalteromonas spongiae UST010723-006]